MGMGSLRERRASTLFSIVASETQPHQRQVTRDDLDGCSGMQAAA